MAKKEDDSKLFAFLAVFLSIIGFLIALIVKKNNKYVMFYAKQSLILFFAWIILSVAAMILSFIPILGMLISWVAYLGLVIFWILGLVYSLSGEMKEIPVIGNLAQNLKF